MTTPPTSDERAMDRYSLYMKTVQGGALRGLFETLCHIIHDTNLCWEPVCADDDTGGGLKVLTMDSARCALIFLKLDGNNFDEFHCPGPLITGVNMSSVWKLLKTASSRDCISMYVETTDPHNLGITIHDSEKNALTEYKLKMLDCDTETISVPDVSFDRVLTLPSVYFQRICREMSNLGEFMTIAVDGNSLKLSCEGSFASQITSIGETDGCMTVTETTGECVDGSFSLRYLSLFTKASGLCNTVQLYLKKNYPLVLSYQVASLGSIRFCLANRVME